MGDWEEREKEGGKRSVQFPHFVELYKACTFYIEINLIYYTYFLSHKQTFKYLLEIIFYF